jgi:hypothetical protein
MTAPSDVETVTKAFLPRNRQLVLLGSQTVEFPKDAPKEKTDATTSA